MFRLISAFCALVIPVSLSAQESPSEIEIAYVTKLFNSIQERSFAENKELCGYLGYNQEGRLATSRILPGQEATCVLPNWPEHLDVIASFHTHSTYSPEYDSERPSSTDMESDEADGIDGWVATPGGRLWYVDSSEMIAHQICGIGCLVQDPNFVADPPGSVKESYTYRAILKAEAY